MAVKQWWFQFEPDDWLGDGELAACSLETQGFWIRCIAMMRRAEVSKFTGSVDKLRRMFGVLPEELTRCLLDLKENNAANVTIGNDFVTVESRRLTRELKAKEKNRLKVAKHRENKDGNHDVTAHNKSKSLKLELESNPNLDSKEESRAASPALPLKKPESPNGVSGHPAVVVYEEIFGPVPNAAFAKAVASSVTNLGLWSNLVAEKSSYDKPHGWILGEYQKRVAESPPPSNSPPGKIKTARELNAEAREEERRRAEEIERAKREQAAAAETDGNHTTNGTAES